MDENTEKQTENRPKGPQKFAKGVSGNPNGRPKKERCFSDIARQMLASKKMDITYTFPKDGKLVTSRVSIDSDKTIYHGLCAALVREGMGGNVQAIKELVDRTEGKAREFIDHTSKGKEIAAPPVFQIVDEKTRSLCGSIVSGNGRESSPDGTDDAR
jgi:hypothetical protein